MTNRTSIVSIIWAAFYKRPFFGIVVMLIACQPVKEDIQEEKKQPKKKKTPTEVVVQEETQPDTAAVSEVDSVITQRTITEVYARGIELYFEADSNWIEFSLSQQERIYSLVEMAIEDMDQDLELAVKDTLNDSYVLIFSSGVDYLLSEYELTELISSQSDMYTNLRNEMINGYSYFIFDVMNEKVFWQKAMGVTKQNRPFTIEYIVRTSSDQSQVKNIEEVLQFIK